MKMKNTYIFDFDGVIVDSMPTWAGTLVEILDEYNIEYPENIVEIITPMGMKKTAEYFVELGIKNKTPDELLGEILERMKYEYENSIVLKPYVADKLKEIKQSGATIVLLTASPHMFFEPCLKREGLYDLFDYLFSCDDFNLPKSEPEIYYEVSKIIKKDLKNCYFFDDNIGAVKGAKSAGLTVVGVYDKTAESFKDEMKKTASKYIDNFSQI